MGSALTPERIAAIQQVIARQDWTRSRQARELGVNLKTVRTYVARFGGERRGHIHVPPKVHPRQRGELARIIYGTDRLEDLAWGVTFTPPDPVGRRA